MLLSPQCVGFQGKEEVLMEQVPLRFELAVEAQRQAQAEKQSQELGLVAAWGRPEGVRPGQLAQEELLLQLEELLLQLKELLL